MAICDRGMQLVNSVPGCRQASCAAPPPRGGGTTGFDSPHSPVRSSSSCLGDDPVCGLYSTTAAYRLCAFSAVGVDRSVPFLCLESVGFCRFSVGSEDAAILLLSRFIVVDVDVEG